VKEALGQDLNPRANQLFVIPNAAEREFFYGVNFEISYEPGESAL